jgi:hypothetical protein
MSRALFHELQFLARRHAERHVEAKIQVPPHSDANDVFSLFSFAAASSTMRVFIAAFLATLSIANGFAIRPGGASRSR